MRLPDALEAYAEIRQGVQPDQTPRQFIESSALTIINISAAQAAASLNLKDYRSLRAWEMFMVAQLMEGIYPHYDDDENRFKTGSQPAIKTIATTKVGELTREYFPYYLAAAKLDEVTGSPIGVIQQAKFDFYLQYAQSLIPEAKELDPHWTKEQVLNLVGEDIKDLGYRASVQERLAPILDNTKDLSAEEKLLVIASLHHANLNWQVAQPIRHASINYTKGITQPEIDYSRLTQPDFASFNDMPPAVFQKHLNKLHDGELAILLAGVKLAQDAIEYTSTSN